MHLAFNRLIFFTHQASDFNNWEKMRNFIICFHHTQWEVFFQIKFHPGMKFYSFHPGMKLTCKQNFFHLGMRFHLGYMWTHSKSSSSFLLPLSSKYYNHYYFYYDQGNENYKTFWALFVTLVIWFFNIRFVFSFLFRACVEPCKTSVVEVFAKIGNG